MKRSDLIQKTRKAIQFRGLELSTEDSYIHHINRFCTFRKDNPEAGIDDYLSHIAPNYSKSTQDQALNALVFFYRHVLERKVGKLKYRKSRRDPKAVDFLTHEECHRLFGQMSGVPQLQAQIMYGTGLRVSSELLPLRIKDLCFSSRTITARCCKGNKDRTLPMPSSLADQLREQVEKARYWWEIDQKQGNPPPYLPDSLAKKLGRQISDFGWFWVFPASNLSRDPRSQIVRRHHLTRQGIANALTRAAKRAKIAKRVHPHVLRHSFATSMLLNGIDIKNLSILMGHKSIETTERYLHALPQLAFRAVSPLDAEPPNVTVFPAIPEEVSTLATFNGSVL